ncbi:prion-inhibition and propagation-domain-containing protein [Chaetomium sp. MPI-SDFR-AT-0129]|nr:prion-inhibition and propagation-domain-containing protein [Chaetomium sp. MPI-SDFR-AT-0129]
MAIAGLALGVASIGLQVYTGCIQGIQLLITASNFPEDCRYLNLRLRMEQQRLFAWSETSGLLDLDSKNRERILESNTFVLHRQTVLDLLMQVECLFKEFKQHQLRHQRLQPTPDQDGVLEKPEKDAAEANFPLPQQRRNFIKKAMQSLKSTSKDTAERLRWVSFDKAAFELLLSRFSTLNDSMTNILDARMQVEIHHTVQDTNRGVLQLHHKIADLSRLVMALNLKLESKSTVPESRMSVAQKRANADGLELLSQLAKFKAFNESIESSKKTPWDEAAGMYLELGKPSQPKNLELDRSMVSIEPAAEKSDHTRCDATLNLADGTKKKVWVEWKDYDRQRPGDQSPPKKVIYERVRKLAALLNHSPKPEAFRTPHCLGFFDKASSNGVEDEEEDILNMRLGLVFERPLDANLHASLPPVSLRELLETSRKPRVTDRVKLAHAISNCVLYLHAVNWLHKGLRSHNIIFFRSSDGQVDYAKPYLSGFDFSRPARADEMTDVPGDDAEYNLYRHPLAQSTRFEDRERSKKSFDIYSLGVLLVEIAHWATVEKVLGIDLNAARGRSSIALKVRETLLEEEQIAELGASMGAVYETASWKCIAGGKELGLSEGDDETDDAVAARLSMVLHEDVVKKLGEIRI